MKRFEYLQIPHPLNKNLAKPAKPEETLDLIDLV